MGGLGPDDEVLIPKPYSDVFGDCYSVPLLIPCNAEVTFASPPISLKAITPKMTRVS
ncbi:MULTISPECIES: hypothetical protein [Chelativorans]|jgi:hypothetical protein|uniref:hypothetical protein n=1 Tax=Chelativorans TaxID=449972 RepID=UPI00003A2ED8|nr:MULTISPECIES: hypothetical protein [Chelativorans]